MHKEKYMEEITIRSIVSKTINQNRFISSIAHGLTMGLWNRYYAENLSFTWTQGQILVMFLAGYIVNDIASKNFGFRKTMFYIRNKIGFVVRTIDFITIIWFTFTHNPIILFVGDTISCIFSEIEAIAWTEMHSATFTGNFRAEHSARNMKANNLGSIIAYVTSMLLAIFIVGDKPISEEILLWTQYIMVVVCYFIYFRGLKIFKLTRPLVESMWAEKENK